MPQPFAHPAVPVRVDPATSLIPHLAADVGDNLCRDAVDQQLIDQLLSFGRLGKLIADETEIGGLPAQLSGNAPVDTDGDGIPDAWEKLHHLNPNDPADGATLDPATGYSHLELYLNDLVGKPHCSRQRAWSTPSSCFNEIVALTRESLVYGVVLLALREVF
jgi:hypothetical protein